MVKPHIPSLIGISEAGAIGTPHQASNQPGRPAVEPIRMARAPTLLLLICAPLVAVAQSPHADTTERGIERLFAGWTGPETPGCAVGVSRKGERVFQGGFGLANLETNTAIIPATIFQAASIAKQFTALSVLLLERDGKLALDDDVRKFMPELPDYG